MEKKDAKVLNTLTEDVKDASFWGVVGPKDRTSWAAYLKVSFSHAIQTQARGTRTDT